MSKTREIREALKNVSKGYQCDICGKFYEDKGKAVKCAKKHFNY